MRYIIRTQIHQIIIKYSHHHCRMYSIKYTCSPTLLSHTYFLGTSYSWLWVLKKPSLSQWTGGKYFCSLNSLQGSKYTLESWHTSRRRNQRRSSWIFWNSFWVKTPWCFGSWSYYNKDIIILFIGMHLTKIEYDTL